jgi:hypothetical protein
VIFVLIVITRLRWRAARSEIPPVNFGEHTF